MARLQHQDYPKAVVFEERDGIYWLSPDDVCLVQEASGRDFGGITIGFDKHEAMVQALGLMKRGIQVGLRRGDAIRMLRPPAQRSAKRMVSSQIFLAPEVLLGRRELANLMRALERRPSSISKACEHWKTRLLRETEEAVEVYVYEVAGGFYEVNWKLTEISEGSFQGLAVASHLLDRRLPCRLITPGQARRRVRTIETGQEPAVYGQLQLSL